MRLALEKTPVANISMKPTIIVNQSYFIVTHQPRHEASVLYSTMCPFVFVSFDRFGGMGFGPSGIKEAHTSCRG